MEGRGDDREGGGACHKGRVSDFRVYVLAQLLRREFSACGWVGWLSTRWVGGEGGGLRNYEECTGLGMGWGGSCGWASAIVLWSDGG